jgi:hypothetical protein
MRLAQRSVWLIAMVVGLASFAASQAAAPAHKPAVPWKRYCQPNAGFCFKYPPTWTMLGEVFDGNGVVVAPPQRDEQPLQSEVTVAMVAPPKDSDDALGLDAIIQQAAAGMRESGQDFQTLRRQERTVDAKPAELLKAQYHEKSTGKDWVEELIFIQGPDNEIYSVALKCTPSDIVHLEPVFSEIVRTWTLPQPEPPAGDTDESAPTQPAPPAKPSAQPTH